MNRSLLLSVVLFVGAVCAASKPSSALDRARQLFHQERYEQAVVLFHQAALAGDAPGEALFHEAECLRKLKRYPDAAGCYRRLLVLARTSTVDEGVRVQAFRQLYEIANYWLEDTREQMRRDRECRTNFSEVPRLQIGSMTIDLNPMIGEAMTGGRYWRNLFHWDQTKPWFNEEGRAVEELLFLEAAGAPDDLAEKSLFLAAAVHFYRENYRGADSSLSWLVQRFPRGALSAQALELALVAKIQLLGQGSDGARIASEARVLIAVARRDYPELARKTEFFEAKQLCLDNFESEQALKKADKAMLTGEKEQARKLYLELLRTYPHTESASQAKGRLKKVFGGQQEMD